MPSGLGSLLFTAFPYVAVTFCILAAIYRHKVDQFSWSSFSSQFLEKRTLFWGSSAWHYGVIIILLAHVLAFLVSPVWAIVIADPARLYTLEVFGLVVAIWSVLGLMILMVRRLLYSRVRAVTSRMDWLVETILLAQMTLGFWVALRYRWGSDWFLYTSVPWLGSLLRLSPDIHYVTALPWTVKLHILGGFLLIGLFPVSRLVHVVSLPITYALRPYQVVIWNRRGPVREREVGRAHTAPMSGGEMGPAPAASTPRGERPAS